MTTPTDPTRSHSVPPIQSQAQPSALDPSGAWSKFLGGASGVATPEEVKQFMQGIMKMFNIIIQQQNEAYKRANQRLKNVAEGKE